MGCDSPDTNFNNFVWQDGTWWCTSGWDYSYTAPNMQILWGKLGERMSEYRFNYSRERKVWTATPLPKDTPPATEPSVPMIYS